MQSFSQYHKESVWLWNHIQMLSSWAFWIIGQSPLKSCHFKLGSHHWKVDISNQCFVYIAQKTKKPFEINWLQSLKKSDFYVIREALGIQILWIINASTVERASSAYPAPKFYVNITRYCIAYKLRKYKILIYTCMDFSIDIPVSCRVYLIFRPSWTYSTALLFQESFSSYFDLLIKLVYSCSHEVLLNTVVGFSTLNGTVL